MSSFVKTLSVGVCALALVSCASTKPMTSSRIANNAEVVPGGYEPGDHDPVAKAAFWGTRFDREPDNTEVAVKFSKALRDMGSNEEAMNVMNRAWRAEPQNADVSLEYGKVLIANDRAFEAVRPLEQAIAAGKGSDWRAYSAYGVALDKIGEHRAARAQYDLALKLNPNSAVILNNKGLSYALSGQIDNAERTLRFAAATTAGTPTVRQNLAMILAFSGDTNEAERLARSDLPPRVADNNVAYFRSLVNQPAYWQAFDGDNVEMPSFEPPVETTAVEESFVPEVRESAPAPQPLTPTPRPQPKPEPTPEPVEETPSTEVLSSLDEELNSVPGISAPVAGGQPIQLENASVAEENDDEKPGEEDAGV